MNVIFWQRNFNNLLTPLPVRYQVQRYSHSVIGGPKMAEISVTGPELDLWELAEYARNPIKIISEKGDAVWWGFVSEIKIDVGLWSVGINIDTMANVVGVAYEDDAAQGQPKITDWAQDDGSVAEYGQREILITSSGSNETHALAARDKYLAEKKYPVPVITPRDKGKDQAQLICRGWFDSLAWRYAPIPASLFYSYENVDMKGFIDQSVGDDTAHELAQGIWLSGNCDLYSISLYVKKVGSPTDNLKVALWSAVDGLPGAELTSGTVAGSSLGTSFAWKDIAVTEYDLTGYNSYFIKVSRSGSQDASNYYHVQLDGTAEYTLGDLLVSDGSSWTEIAADMPFRIYSNDDIETTQQISTFGSNFGQFIKGMRVDDQSGLYTASVRDGNANAYYEITELMKMGTSNYRRILGTIDEFRKLIIYEEPAIPTYTNLILRDGSLRDPYDTELRKEICPVGIWARFKDIIPGSVDTSRLADPSKMFIDEAEYSPIDDRLSLTPRGFIDPFQIGRPRDG
jgi:hypothetical protein